MLHLALGLQRGLAPYTQQSRATGPPKGGLIPGGACMLPLAGMQGAVLSQSVACVWRRATHLQRRQVLCCLHIPLAGVVVPVELQGDRGCGWGGVGAEREEGGWHWVEVGVGVGRAERVGSSWTDAQGENGPLQCKAAEPATNTAAARVAPTTNKPARVGANCYAGSILYVGIFCTNPLILTCTRSSESTCSRCRLASMLCTREAGAGRREQVPMATAQHIATEATCGTRSRRRHCVPAQRGGMCCVHRQGQ